MEIIKILFINQFCLTKEEKIEYRFEKNKVEINYKGLSEKINFEGLPNGKLEIYDEEKNKRNIKHNVGIDYLISAERKNGVLYLTLLNHIPENASWDERFNKEIHYTEYKPTLFSEDKT